MVNYIEWAEVLYNAGVPHDHIRKEVDRHIHDLKKVWLNDPAADEAIRQHEGFLQLMDVLNSPT